MNAPAKKVAQWLIVVVIAGVVMWFGILPHVLYSGPVIRNTPMMLEVSRMHEICTKLVFYADEHHSSAPGNTIGKSVGSLVAAGIISADDATYIREHQIEFRGFDPTKIGADIPVLETVFTYTQTPHRIVGYTDGSVVVYDLHKAQKAVP
jgi:hypothetical protein